MFDCRHGIHTKGKVQMQGCLRKVISFGLLIQMCYALVKFLLIISLAENFGAWFYHTDMNLYTIRAVPFADVRSIRRHTPTLGWQYIIVVLSSGKEPQTILRILLKEDSGFYCTLCCLWFWDLVNRTDE